jgi:hypothetical protein
MRVRIDQHRVNRLLAECANAPLPFEIRQVRINRNSTDAGNAGGGVSNFGPANYNEMANTGSGPGGAVAKEVDPHEITLEVFGIVYLYNPSNNILLKLPENGPPATAATASPVPLAGVAGTR